ncbi:TonB family protein [Desulfovibrio aminophilus]|uniref:energy transducer TonB n=1 Tax=Desulfovibrio aminophilus TaxID=81425 RepID=UPI003398B614
MSGGAICRPALEPVSPPLPRGGKGLGFIAALLALILHGLALVSALLFLPNALEYDEVPAYEVELVSFGPGEGDGHEHGASAIAARVASIQPKRREPVAVHQTVRPAKSVPPRVTESAPAPVTVPDPKASDVGADTPAPSETFAAAPADAEEPGSVMAETHPAGLPRGEAQGLGHGGYGLGQVERAPRLLRKVEPKYPLTARKRQVTGKVLVKFLVDPEGRVRHLDVVESRPEGVFDQAAVEAVSAWEFTPGVLRGRSVSVWMLLPISFTLQ